MDLISPYGNESLDIDAIRESFKNYLQEQGIIKDVNYIGSNISLLVDIMSYAIKNLNSSHALIANETLLKLSTTRQNIIFLASQLGYEITRRISAIMPITISYDIAPSSGISLTIPKFTKFQCGEYYFLNTADILLDETQQSQSIFLKQGIGIDKNIDPSLGKTIESPIEHMMLNYQFIENDSIEVKVRRSCESGDFTIYKRVMSLVDLSENTYYEEIDPTTGYIKLYFYFSGYGKLLDVGDVIDISFIISDGKKANGISTCELSEIVVDSSGVEVSPTITVTSASYNGQDEESNDSIRNNAPLFYNSANRTVTEVDYQAYLEKSSLVRTAVAWGGELMSPSVLGTIFLSVVPQDEKSDYLSDLEIVELIELLKGVRIVSTYRKFFQPVYLNMSFNINILGDVKSISDKQQLIETNLSEYFSTNLNKFNSMFYESKLIKVIESVFIEDTASVNIEFVSSIEMTTKHFEYNINEDGYCVFFIPNSSKRYYLTKDNERIDVPIDDNDLYTYLNNGWVKVYEPNEMIDITFSYNDGINILETGNKYVDGDTEKKDIIWNGNVVGYFDVGESVLYITESFKTNINDMMSVNITFDPNINIVTKYNTILKLGQISYV